MSVRWVWFLRENLAINDLVSNRHLEFDLEMSITKHRVSYYGTKNWKMYLIFTNKKDKRIIQDHRNIMFHQRNNTEVSPAHLKFRKYSITMVLNNSIRILVEWELRMDKLIPLLLLIWLTCKASWVKKIYRLPVCSEEYYPKLRKVKVRDCLSYMRSL